MTATSPSRSKRTIDCSTAIGGSVTVRRVAAERRAERAAAAQVPCAAASDPVVRERTSEPRVRPSVEDNHAAGTDPRLQLLVAVVDLVELDALRDQLVELDATLLVEAQVVGHVDA